MFLLRICLCCEIVEVVEAFPAFMLNIHHTLRGTTSISGITHAKLGIVIQITGQYSSWFMRLLWTISPVFCFGFWGRNPGIRSTSPQIDVPWVSWTFRSGVGLVMAAMFGSDIQAT